jgi:hypothetical protein
MVALLVAAVAVPTVASAQGSVTTSRPDLTIESLGTPFIVEVRENRDLGAPFPVSHNIVVPAGYVLVLDWASAAIQFVNVPVGDSLAITLMSNDQIVLGKVPNVGEKHMFFGAPVRTILRPGAYQFWCEGLDSADVSVGRFALMGRLIPMPAQ